MKKEVFIIDDDVIYRMIVAHTINRIDSSVSIKECKNGEIGLTMLEHLSNSKDKIIVLLDINMPVLDGWGFLDQIEKCAFYNIQQLVIYIVSSSTDESDILKSKKYKFVSGFFHKPISSTNLASIIGSD